MAILVGICVLVLIVLVCYYRRRLKAEAGETSHIMPLPRASDLNSRVYLVSSFIFIVAVL